MIEKDIADKLSIEIQTVKNHCNAAYRILKVDSMMRAINKVNAVRLK